MSIVIRGAQSPTPHGAGPDVRGVRATSGAAAGCRLRKRPRGGRLAVIALGSDARAGHCEGPPVQRDVADRGVGAPYPDARAGLEVPQSQSTVFAAADRPEVGPSRIDAGDSALVAFQFLHAPAICQIPHPQAPVRRSRKCQPRRPAHSHAPELGIRLDLSKASSTYEVPEPQRVAARTERQRRSPVRCHGADGRRARGGELLHTHAGLEVPQAHGATTVAAQCPPSPLPDERDPHGLAWSAADCG
mmetsp:Transcript_41216/g.116622  ORF Transcript_41216/g.116622 Transcript_41216/m.116622 type:complete len:246 (+) Transcript_41216:576-1313(+)